jgi:hypothetical protein
LVGSLPSLGRSLILVGGEGGLKHRLSTSTLLRRELHSTTQHNSTLTAVNACACLRSGMDGPGGTDSLTLLTHFHGPYPMPKPMPTPMPAAPCPLPTAVLPPASAHLMQRGREAVLWANQATARAGRCGRCGAKTKQPHESSALLLAFLHSGHSGATARTMNINVNVPGLALLWG